MSGNVQSDVDIVVGSFPPLIVGQALSEFRTNRLHPIVINPYDAGGSASVYMATDNAEGGLQLDMYYDPRGVGRFGLRTGPLLSNSVQGVQWPVVSPEYRAVYLLRKRHWKGEKPKIDRLREEVRLLDQRKLEEAMRSLTTPTVSRSLNNLIQDNWHNFRSSTGNVLADQQRRLKRIRQPVGFWISIQGAGSERIANDLARRFENVIRTKVGKRPTRRWQEALWLAREVAPIRWKPGLFVSWSSGSHEHFAADLDLSTSDDDPAGLVVRSMEARLRFPR